MKLSEAIEVVAAEHVKEKADRMGMKNAALTLRKAIETNIDCALNFVSSDNQVAIWETIPGKQIKLRANDTGSVTIIDPEKWEEEVLDVAAGMKALARAIR